MQKNITKNLKQGITISFYTRIATQASTFIFGLVLARLLSPEEYGVVGVLTVFLVIIKQFQDFGFGVSLLQQKRVLENDYNTIFVLNVFMSFLLYATFYSLAPFIADFFNDPRLIKIVKVIGLVNIVQAFGSTQGVYLNKCQHYKSQAIIFIIAIVFSSIFAVILAYLDYGYWALIGKSMMQVVIMAIGWWLISPWKPKIRIKVDSIKRLFSFGSKLFLNSLIENIFRNVYSLIIGKLYNMDTLGYYNRAKNFNDLPDQTIRQSLFGKIFPALSYFQDNNEKLIRSYQKLMIILVFVLYPIYIMLFIIAKPMIVTLITIKWIDTAPLLQIFCVSAIFFPFESVFQNILYVKGKSKYLLIITIVRRVIFVGLIFTVYRFGIEALVGLLVIDAGISTILSYYFSQKVLKFPFLKQFKLIKKIIFCLVSYTLVMILVSSLFNESLYKFIFTVLSGSITYLVLSYYCMNKELFQVLQLLKIDKSINKIIRNVKRGNE